MAGPRQLAKDAARREADERRLAARRETLESRKRVDADNAQVAADLEAKGIRPRERFAGKMQVGGENKALTGDENKGADDGGGDSLAAVSFASPQARQAAVDAGLTAEDFKRRRKGSESGYNKDDVARIAASRGTPDEGDEG